MQHWVCAQHLPSAMSHGHAAGCPDAACPRSYMDSLKFGIDAVHAAHGIAEGTICYTGDLLNPRRSDKVNFVELAHSNALHKACLGS